MSERIPSATCVFPALEQDVRRIMCIRLGSLGDVVFALHALRLLRKERPAMWISWLVEERFSGLLLNHPDLDDLKVVPRRRWTRSLLGALGSPGVLAEASRLAGSIRAMRLDATLDFHGNLRSGLWSRVIGAPVRIGYARGCDKEFNHLFQNATVALRARKVHKILRALCLLEPLGIRPRYERPAIPVAEDARDHIRAQLNGARSSGRRLVVIHPGSSVFGSIKRWPADRFAAVADRLIDAHDCDVVLSWGPGERDEASRVLALMRKPGRLAPHTSSVDRLAALLELADLVIACDTGPLHLAAALARPLVGLYGPKDPEIYGPVGTKGLIVQGLAHCAPCARRRCNDLLCMTTITADAVYDAASRVLAGAGRTLDLPM